MLGLLGFYDEATAWGLILGEDGRLYAVRRSHMLEPGPQPGDRVTFEPRRGPGGLRAITVRQATDCKSTPQGPPDLPARSTSVWRPPQRTG
jgi:cold shock CspA family protein